MFWRLRHWASSLSILSKHATRFSMIFTNCQPLRPLASWVIKRSSPKPILGSIIATAQYSHAHFAWLDSFVWRHDLLCASPSIPRGSNLLLIYLADWLNYSYSHGVGESIAFHRQPKSGRHPSRLDSHLHRARFTVGSLCPDAVHAPATHDLLDAAHRRCQ